jgi:Ca-activated chloride channel family protein
VALIHDSENKDARYNLELALRKKDKQKQAEQKQDGQKSETDKDRPPGYDQQKDEGEQKSKVNQKNEQDESKSEQNKGDKKNMEQQGEKETEKRAPQDLSGELNPRQAMEGAKEGGQSPGEDRAGLDRKKAEALLDNIREDPSKILRFQIPREKRSVGSGKNW